MAWWLAFLVGATAAMRARAKAGVHAKGSPGGSPTQRGMAEAALLLRSATWLAHRAENDSLARTASAAAAVRSIRVAANSTVFVGYDSGVEKIDFSDPSCPTRPRSSKPPHKYKSWRHRECGTVTEWVRWEFLVATLRFVSLQLWKIQTRER